MSIKERKEREWGKRRELILNVANDIIIAEGIDNLSIRKIANKIEYSPSIIYHYFQSKDDILNQLMQINYQNITGMLSQSQASTNDSMEKIRKMTAVYIHWALEVSDQYKAMMLSNSSSILEHTSILFKGASIKRPTLDMLCQCLKEIYKDMDNSQIELTAQVIWTATFGLIMRLIIEKDIDEEQKESLIDHHIKYLINRIG